MYLPAARSVLPEQMVQNHIRLLRLQQHILRDMMYHGNARPFHEYPEDAIQTELLFDDEWKYSITHPKEFKSGHEFRLNQFLRDLGFGYLSEGTPKTLIKGRPVPGHYDDITGEWVPYKYEPTDEDMNFPFWDMSTKGIDHIELGFVLEDIVLKKLFTYDKINHAVNNIRDTFIDDNVVTIIFRFTDRLGKIVPTDHSKTSQIGVISSNINMQSFVDDIRSGRILDISLTNLPLLDVYAFMDNANVDYANPDDPANAQYAISKIAAYGLLTQLGSADDENFSVYIDGQIDIEMESHNQLISSILDRDLDYVVAQKINTVTIRLKRAKRNQQPDFPIMIENPDFGITDDDGNLIYPDAVKYIEDPNDDPDKNVDFDIDKYELLSFLSDGGSYFDIERDYTNVGTTTRELSLARWMSALSFMCEEASNEFPSWLSDIDTKYGIIKYAQELHLGSKNNNDPTKYIVYYLDREAFRNLSPYESAKLVKYIAMRTTTQRTYGWALAGKIAIAVITLGVSVALLATGNFPMAAMVLSGGAALMSYYAMKNAEWGNVDIAQSSNGFVKFFTVAAIAVSLGSVVASPTAWTSGLTREGLEQWASEAISDSSVALATAELIFPSVENITLSMVLQAASDPGIQSGDYSSIGSVFVSAATPPIIMNFQQTVGIIDLGSRNLKESSPGTGGSADVMDSVVVLEQCNGTMEEMTELNMLRLVRDKSSLLEPTMMAQVMI